MPLVPSSFKARGLFKNAHFSTIYSAKLRPAPTLKQERERLWLPDGDFLDLDMTLSAVNDKIAILLHGLEGNAQRTYMVGQGRVLANHQWDVCAMNYRGCSGEPNNRYASYNAGKTEDLEAVVTHLLQKEQYRTLALVGFSLGGNLLLKYLGERENVPSEIKKAVAISTPLNLRGSLEALSQFNNIVYRTSFLHNLRKKYKGKMAQFPDKMSPGELKKITSLLEFDHRYTAPAHGYDDAFDYYEKNSSGQFIDAIQMPVLLLNAKNDSFLTHNCYPYDYARDSKNFYLETPDHGGHVGFHVTNSVYYSEKRTVQFLHGT
jgi:predicted alpha/beta-fold hydrolase